MPFASIARRFATLLLALLPLLATLARAQGTLPQTIQFVPISDRPVTTAPFYAVAIASSQLPVTLAVQGPASLDGRRLLTLTGPGSITLTATQAGNSQYAPTSAQITFQSTPAPVSVAWQPPSTMVYGMPLSSGIFNASATAIPMFSPQADTTTVSMQLDTSAIAPGAPITYPQTSSVFRYEGSTMVATTDPLSGGGYVPVGSAPPLGINYTVAFTCNCAQFEYVVQSRSSSYRIWVDGSYQSLDAITPADHFPEQNFVRVQFPDKRTRQVKVVFSGAPPFFGVNTVGGDTISAPQVPIGGRVIIFGDSWTGPTILQAVLPPPQDGLSGSGYPQYLGEYFNWDYWDSGVGGEGFTNPGTDANGHNFAQRLLTDVCPFSPAAVVLMGGTNDGGSPEATDQQGIDAALSNLQSCLPGVPVYLYGPQFSNGLLDTAFANVVPNYKAVHYVDMGAQNWLYGPENSSATGNEYLYFAGHPTPLGHNFLAEKIAADLLATYPSLLPTPYSLFSPAPAAGSFSYSATAGALLPAGNNTVTATFTPADQVNYADGSLQATIAVSQATSALSASTQTQNGIPTITVTASPQYGGTPSGAVVVAEAGSMLATLNLSQGTASYTANSLASGPHTLTFTYGGDNNFSGSSTTVAVTVTQPAPPPADFTVSASPAQLTLKAGSSGLVQLAITPSGALNANLQLSCVGLPAQATCSFANGSTTVAVGQVPVTANVTITTGQQIASFGKPARTGGRGPSGALGETAVCGVLGVGLLTLRGRRRSRARLVATLAGLALSLGALGLSGCGTPPGNYSLQLQLTNSSNPSMSHAATITLVVD